MNMNREKNCDQIQKTLPEINQPISMIINLSTLNKSSIRQLVSVKDRMQGV